MATSPAMPYLRDVATSMAWPGVSRQNVLPLFEKLLILAGLLVFLGVVRGILSPEAGDDRASGTAIFQLTFGGIYLAGIATLVYRGIPRWTFSLLVVALPLVALTLFALLSTLWSQAPDATFRRAVALILGSCFTVYIVVRVDPRTFFNLVLVAFAIFIAVNIAAVAAGAGIAGGGNYAGAWEGITGNKNNFGRTVALAVLLLPMAAAVGLISWRKTALAVSFVALLLLFLSQSATPLISAPVGIFGGILLYLLCGGRLGGIRFSGEVRAVCALLIVISGVVLITAVVPLVLEALGRDPTLSGRTKLWDWSLSVNGDRKLLGSGYRAFWIDKNTKYFFVSFAWSKDADGNLSESYTGPTHAHSGYVDTILELGYVGLALYVGAVLSGIVILCKALRRGSYAVGLMFAAILVFIHVYATAARSILQQSEDVWFFFTVLYLFTAKETLKDRLVPAPLMARPVPRAVGSLT